jgi:hypothetical protein
MLDMMKTPLGRLKKNLLLNLALIGLSLLSFGVPVVRFAAILEKKSGAKNNIVLFEQSA